jgi:hypothetical protein
MRRAPTYHGTNAHVKYSMGVCCVSMATQTSTRLLRDQRPAAQAPIQTALDKVALGLMDQHTHHCVVGASDDRRDGKTGELMAAVGRLMRRG